MPTENCTIREHQVGSLRAVTISNGLLSVTVLPKKGADIYALEYMPRGVDVLWKSPWGLRRPGSSIPSAANSEAAWLEHYEGGWQDLFPNGGDACSYRGAGLNFHGEASVIAWDYALKTRRASAVEVEFTAQLARSPFRMRRTIRLERASRALLIAERIENRAEEDLHYMWGQHPAFGAPFLDGGCRLHIPARTFLAHAEEISPHCRALAGAQSAWPFVEAKGGGVVDLATLPPAADRVTEFGYLSDIEQGWYGLTNPRLGFGFGLAWPKEVFPYLWFWQELRGSFGYPWYGSCYVMAVEPFTSIPGVGLLKAIEYGTAPVLRAGGSVESRIAAVFFDAGEPKSISTDGSVRLRHEPGRS